MNFVAAWRSAWKALAANALRSLLTMLGIIIGVAAVITMMAVGRGATDRVQAQMKGLGSNIMLVLNGGINSSGTRLGAQSNQRLTEEDAQAMALEVPEVQVAAPTSRTGYTGSPPSRASSSISSARMQAARCDSPVPVATGSSSGSAVRQASTAIGHRSAKVQA